MQDREGLADRGNVVILLYNARKYSGVNEQPPSSALITPPNSSLHIINHNTTLQGDTLRLSYDIQKIVEEEIKSLVSSTLLNQTDLALFDKNIALHYSQ